MANRNRNKGRYESDDNWNKDRDFHENDPNRGLVNYGRENELNRNRGYGNSDYGNSESGYGNTGYGSNSGGYQQNVNRQDYPTQGSSWGADHGVGNYGRRDNDWNDQPKWNTRNQGTSGGDMNYNTGHGNTGAYNSGNYRNAGRYQDYNRQNSGNQSNMYGGDTRNYGNANQGSFDRDWWDKTRDEVSSWFGDEDAERRRRMDAVNNGPYKGKGPKGYKRSDERIKEDVCDRLCDSPMIDASDIDIKVDGSEVILTGTVETREDKRRAEDIAESVSGVANVQNNLRVNRGTSTGRSDYTAS